MYKGNMKHLLIVNGLDHAFRKEFGCPCKRCSIQNNTANTSVSLVGVDENSERVIYHILIDIGTGVVDSLANCSYLSGDKARLDQLLISHWHPDHLLELNRLCESWRRTLKRSGEPWKSVPAWCRSGTAEWLKRNYSYECSKFLNLLISNEFNPPGTVLAPVPLKSTIQDLTITPVTVSHCTADINPRGEEKPCSASFVVQYREGGKAVMLWDIDNKNNWIENPTSEEEKEAVNLLSNADYLFIACNTWSIEKVNGSNTGHASFHTIQRYVRALSPRGKTLLVHLSGHEDGEGNPGWGWSNQTWEEHAQKFWEVENLPGKIYVPKIGDMFEIK